MDDALAAYHAEIRAVEDAWFDQRIGSPIYSAGGPASLWVGELPRLREIDEKHGIRHQADPRVYSIAVFRSEERLLRIEWECYEREYRTNPPADPEHDSTNVRVFYRHRARQADCEARHFPGVFIRDEKGQVDTLPKLWFLIVQSLEVLRRANQTDWGRASGLPRTRRKAEEVYSLLHKLHVPWALDPMGYPQDFTERQYLDQLRQFANRLMREEAEGFADDLRLRFAHVLPPGIPIPSPPKSSVEATSRKVERRPTAEIAPTSLVQFQA